MYLWVTVYINILKVYLNPISTLIYLINRWHKIFNKTKLWKYINYIVIILQVLGLILAIEVGGWFRIIYIGINIIWASWWAYNNWDIIDSASDYILTSIKQKPYYKGKEIKLNNKKKKKN